MDVHGDELPGLNLPPLSPAQSIVPPTDSADMPPIATAAPDAPQVPAPNPVAPRHPFLPSLQVPVAAEPPVAADDRSDDMDEEWVNKAKAIVEKTKGDPHIESGELSKVKADYLNTRYNKHIKVAEDHPR